MRKRINHILFGNTEKTFEERIFIYANLISIVVSFLAIFINIANQIFLPVNIFIGIALIGYFSLILYTRNHSLHTLSFVIYLFLTLIILGISWFQGGGLDSPTIAYYFLAMLVIIFLSNQNNQVWSGTLIFLALIINIFIEYYYPQLINRYPDYLTEFYDLTSSYIVTLFFAGLLVYVFKRNYNRERENVQLKNQELIKLTQEIKEQNEQLALANKTKDKLFSIIAHDLRNPVAALRNTIDILDPAILNSEELEFIKEELSKQFGSMDFTLTNLLIWAKSQLKGEQFQKERINLKKITEQVTELFAPDLFNKEIKVENKISPDTAVFADSNHLQFVLRNVINNAIKFSTHNDIITLYHDVQDKYVIISIQDQGVGISKEKQTKLFNIHTNYSTNGTEGEKGTGLGLILCKEFIEKNDGEIWVESQEGQGSTFFLSLPKA
ncbi:MAG: ATP-binding protein [Thermoflexibacter sp.]|nr:ATP-binding protein [Thermoflexibacter sp.]